MCAPIGMAADRQWAITYVSAAVEWDRTRRLINGMWARLCSLVTTLWFISGKTSEWLCRVLYIYEIEEFFFQNAENNLRFYC